MEHHETPPGTTIVHTHQLNDGNRLSRLADFRLKDAERRRDAAIAQAHDDYTHEVEMLLHRTDRPATKSLAAGKPANAFPWPWRRAGRVAPLPPPCLVAPYGHALTPDVPVFRMFKTHAERAAQFYEPQQPIPYRLTPAGAAAARRAIEAREVNLRG